MDSSWLGRRSTAVWIGASFLASSVLVLGILLGIGVNERGVDLSLQVTARLSFLLFLPAYIGSSAAVLLGPMFEFPRDQARDFGLAFASAQLVHLGMVVTLCGLGAMPPAPTFLIFGMAAVWLYAIALLSIGNLHRRVSPRTSRTMLLMGMNYIMLAFALDFFRKGPPDSLKTSLAYAPFQLLVVAAMLIRFSAFSRRLIDRAIPKRII